MATICAGPLSAARDVRIITRVLVRLIKAPQAYKTMLGVFESVDDASQTVSDIIAAGIVPGAMEMMDQLIPGH